MTTRMMHRFFGILLILLLAGKSYSQTRDSSMFYFDQMFVLSGSDSAFLKALHGFYDRVMPGIQLYQIDTVYKISYDRGSKTVFKNQFSITTEQYIYSARPSSYSCIVAYKDTVISIYTTGGYEKYYDFPLQDAVIRKPVLRSSMPTEGVYTETYYNAKEGLKLVLTFTEPYPGVSDIFNANPFVWNYTKKFNYESRTYKNLKREYYLLSEDGNPYLIIKQ